MNGEAKSHFDSIESAREFVNLLSDSVTEVNQQIDAEIERANSKSCRRLDALQMVSYNLGKLAAHMKKSCRILNDLRTLRRLLFEERATAVPSKPRAIAKDDMPMPAVRSTTPVRGISATQSHLAPN